ncbi:MAG: DNA-directed RNA polymerase [Candidatus Hermodarchaeota archaeon]
MYYLTTLTENVSVPPRRFGEPLDQVILELCRTKFENSVSPEYGIIISVIEIQTLTQGRIVPGDGATHHEVKFRALAFKPLQNEVVRGEVVETAKYGVFIRLGCTDALCHISQLSDDHFILSSQGLLTSREQGLRLSIGDSVRGRIITSNVDHTSMKIAITMKHDYLGSDEWIEGKLETTEQKKDK